MSSALPPTANVGFARAKALRGLTELEPSILFSPIQRYGMPIFGYVDRSAVRRLDRHQFQPFRINGFATKRERSLPPDPGSFNQLPTDSEDTRVRYVSHRSF
jgi:hypothetical protein